VLRTLIAFANTAGGSVLSEAKDGARDVCGAAAVSRGSFVRVGSTSRHADAELTTELAG